MNSVMAGIIGFTVVLWIILGFAFEIQLANKFNNPTSLFVFPRDIYDNTSMNWFGTIFCYILLSIFSILLTIVKIFATIAMLIYEGVHWLFTVGRVVENDEDE